MKKLIASLLIGATVLGGGLTAFAAPNNAVETHPPYRIMMECPSKCPMENCHSKNIKCELKNYDGEDWLEMKCNDCGWFDFEVL